MKPRGARLATLRTVDIPEPAATPTAARSGPGTWPLILGTLALVVVGFAAYAWATGLGWVGSMQRFTWRTTAIQNCRAMAWSQSEFHRKHDAFAASAQALLEQELIAPTLAAAFERWAGNGDAQKPVPRMGCIYRVLQEPGADRNPYHVDQTGRWAVIARPVEGRDSILSQFLILSNGNLYERPDPPDGDSQFDTFLLDEIPTEEQLVLEHWQRVQ